jgi:DNA invertase Pin-like site-specific DNA recombinase
MRSGEALVPMSEDQLRRIFGEGEPDWLEEHSMTGLDSQQVVGSLDTRQMVPTGGLLLPILTAVADFEREMMRERVKAEIDAARNRGAEFGRPKVVFDRKKAAAMRRRGLSLRAIAEELGASKSAVERLFRAETGGETG